VSLYFHICGLATGFGVWGTMAPIWDQRGSRCREGRASRYSDSNGLGVAMVVLAAAIFNGLTKGLSLGARACCGNAMLMRRCLPSGHARRTEKLPSPLTGTVRWSSQSQCATVPSASGCSIDSRRRVHSEQRGRLHVPQEKTTIGSIRVYVLPCQTCHSNVA
jgi:hypothetical protein